MEPVPSPEQGIQHEPQAASSTAIQASAPVAPAGAVALEKPESKPPTTAPLSVRLAPRIDQALAFLLLLLTFFLASFAVMNSDFWQHLAVGRLIAQGDYAFGEDPFSFTSQGPWVNHNWLYDWAMYGVYAMLGETTLVVMKGLLLAAVAVILLQIRRREFALTLPIACLTLGMVAASPRFLFQPTIVSYLFLSLTLLLLFRNEEAAPADSKFPSRLWGLPVLFVLWVNTDGWFILGLLVVALFWLGLAVEHRGGKKAGYAPRHVGIALAASVGACLLNPHHVLAFALPMELAFPLVQLGDLLGLPLPDSLVGSGRAMQQIRFHDPDSLPLFGSFSRAYRLSPHVGWWTWIAYLAILLLSVVSFWLASPMGIPGGRFPWTRALVWIPLALLTMLQSRLMAFFALLSTPILVLNLQDYLRHRLTLTVPSREGRGSPLLGRIAVGLGLVILLVLAWPGWLHASFDNWQAPRRVAWHLAPDPSWQPTADKLKQLHDLGIRRGLSLSSDVTQYCAWAHPDVQHFHDFRFALFPRSFAKLAKARRELAREARQIVRREIDHDNPRIPLDEWHELAREYGLQYVLLTDFRNRATSEMVVRRWTDPDHWPLLYQDGSSFIFGWNPGGRPGLLSEIGVDFRRQAFAPSQAAGMSAWLNDDFPTRSPTLWAKYARAPSRLPVSFAEFGGLEIYGQAMANQLGPHVGWSMVWGLGAGTTASTCYLALLAPVDTAIIHDPAIRMLMMRHARQTLSQAPDDARSYLHLLTAAQGLFNLENYWSGRTNPFNLSLCGRIRQVQMVAAFKAYLTLEPRNTIAHEQLARLYYQMFYLDLFHEHLELAHKYNDRLLPPENDKDWTKRRKERLKKELDFVAKALKARRDEFEIQVAGRDDPFHRFQVALLVPYRNEPSMGLARTALNFLQKVPLDKEKDLGRQRLVIYHQLRLLLMTGKVGEVRDYLNVQKNKHAQGIQAVFLEAKPMDPLSWHQLNVMAAAVVGDYGEMDKSLDAMEAAISEASSLREVWRALAHPGMHMHLNPAIAAVMTQGFEALRLHHPAVWGPPADMAEFRIARGLMALERGDVEAAAGHFQTALRLVEPFSRLPGFFPDRALAHQYLKRLARR